MRARTAFGRWADRRLGGRENALGRWDAAVGGDLGALGEIAAWIAADGISVLFSPSPARNGKGVSNADLGAALARLMGLVACFRPIQPAQIAAARYGDFERLANGTVGVRWNVRRCGWALGGVVDLAGADLEAWRVVVRWGRAAAPDPEDPLLAPRGGRPWTARAVSRSAAAAPAREREQVEAKARPPDLPAPGTPHS